MLCHLPSPSILNDMAKRARAPAPLSDQLIALSNLIHGPPTPQSIDKAKFAIDVWIRELETAKA